MSNLKTSVLVNKQIPEYIREEYPAFIAFVEAYYEFLENKQGTSNNDLTNKAKDLRTIFDVDASINQFEDNFFNTYANLLPRDVAVDKATLIKNVLPLYLSKGSEKSFKFLFRMLFNEELDIIYPKNNVLRASAGNWVVDNKLRVNQDIATVYTCDGTVKTFILAQYSTINDITVYVNGVVQSSGFLLRKEYRKIIFTTAPANGSVVKIVYQAFNIDLLNNRKITGASSGATAIVERASRRIITDQLNLGLPIELVISTKTLFGNFQNGEVVNTDIIDSNGVLISVQATTFSIIRRVNIINGGNSYNVGDVVVVSGGGSTIDATAIIDDVFEGYIDNINVNSGGAVFTDASGINVSGNASAFLSIVVDGIDVSGANAGNVYGVSTDTISDFPGLNILATNYGFTGQKVINSNSTTRISDALTFQNLTVGPISNVKILLSTTPTTITPVLDAIGATYQVANNTVTHTAKGFGSIGRFKINSGGLGYIPGDEIVFGPNPRMCFGSGAAAVVSRTSATGAITRIEVQPPRIAGTANIVSTNAYVTGTGTFFGSELKVNDRVVINNESRFVDTIYSDTSMRVNVAFLTTATNRNVGLYDKLPLGGINYVANSFPAVTVSSPTGTSASIEIFCLASDGEQLSAANSVAQPGSILSVRIISPGSGYQYLPIVDLSGKGSGTATANAEIERSYLATAGRWTSTESILSAADRRLAGSNYYIDYSYITSSTMEFTKYKKILKELLHPVGFINYANYNKTSEIIGNTIDTANVSFLTISGRVNVNSSIYVTGINTRFNIANTKGILTIGSYISVNNQIRTINSIQSNTVLTVSSPFTQYANYQTIFISTTSS
jgi:hypothetical protein